MNSDQTQRDLRDGIVAGLIAYSLWGILPIYFKVVEGVSPVEVLLHRVVWAVPFGALIIQLRGQWREVHRALTQRRTFFWLAVSACFIAVNWYIYIVAVQQGQIFQASLGYYINPLVYMLVGVAFLGERLRPLQGLAVLLATIGVVVLTTSGGQFPGIALFLAVSFTIYGVIRKQIIIGGMPGLFVETLVLLPIAAVWLGRLVADGSAVFVEAGPTLKALLLLAGPLTIVPLLCFALAARRLSLTTLGFMQFLAPTLQFLVGVWYGEALTLPHQICFGCIWLAVTLFSIDAVRRRKAERRAAA